ncbi:Beige protein-like 1 [Paramarasmius palmivorus]|uniref:Beige protein-like 1 n=1 Tax=Paramarasmius palmivorus TaxID=297713 RepID=A0AAW0DDK8_9AGAR
MFRTLLTPLVAKFDLSPRIPTNAPPPVDDEQTPEDFARDVLIELMRNAVENLKQAEHGRARTEVLSEIHRIMLQDAITKEVFRELDGFLVLMSTLSTTETRPQASSPVSEPEEQVLADAIEGIRLVFMVASEAMYDHAENTDYFNTSVGYSSLEHAIQTLVLDPKTSEETLGFLLSLSLHDFSVSGVFLSLREVGKNDIDKTLNEFQSRLGTIIRPQAIFLLWSIINTHKKHDTSIHYAFLKILELLTSKNHRNQAVLSTPEVVHPLMQRFSVLSADDKKEKSLLQKILRRLLDMGSTTPEARKLLHRVIKSDGSLDMEILEVIRTAMKSRWLEHFSLHSRASLHFSPDGMKGMPASGFTFMMWLWVEHLPKAGSKYTLFSARTSSTKALVALTLKHDGKLEILSSGNRNPHIFERAIIGKGRWTHLTLVHYPGRDKSSNPSIRLFVDGVLNDTLNWHYPKPDSYSNETGQYIIGDDNETLNWCIASTHLLSLPLSDDLPRFIHHLGPRYFGHFQDRSLSKFLTYEASTSLNMFLSAVASAQKAKAITPGGSVSSLSLVKAVQDGLGLLESHILFSVTPMNCLAPGPISAIAIQSGNGSEVTQRDFKVTGDIYVVKANCLDSALWKIGGAAVTLRLVQVASTPHELSRALAILSDGIKNSWQNSEDMERLRGYDILGDILRSKAQIINMTGFETLFEFLGINFRTPEQSTVVNVVAYKALALDFELWSHTRKDIQRVFLEHFRTLLVTSRHRKFNIKQRFGKLGLVRRLLFVLQTDWYQHDSLPFVVDALKVAAEAIFTKDDAIKPIVSYLAANLHEDLANNASPHSVVSRVDYKDNHEKAEQVLEILVSLLSNPASYTKFGAALPITRISLLLLGDKPSPVVACQVLILIAISIATSSSFSRKFELVSGWNVLKTVVPTCWDPSVNESAFDVLLGNIDAQGQKKLGQSDRVVVCPHIMPTILSALQSGLKAVARNCSETVGDEVSSWTTESTMEVLIEELMDLHASSGTFRQVFQSQQTTQIFVDAYKKFVETLTPVPEVNQRTIGILEKLTHFGLALALDNAVAGAQKREILDILQKAEIIVNPAAEKTAIDPGLVADTRSVRQRIASTRFSLQVGERAVMKTINRMSEWRKTIQTSERKRLRKNLLDLRESRRQVSRLYDWTHALTAERGLWPDQNGKPPLWRLDETEGPQRIRKKMEPDYNETLKSTQEERQPIRNIEVPESDNASIAHTEVPPWAESYEIASTEMDDRQLAEDIVDDKHRRVRHELAPGDVIEAVGTVARIAGVDSSPGLLIIGRTHVYMLDGLVESEEGEVIDAHEAPKSLFFVPGSIVELDGPQRAQRWEHEQILTYSNKTFLFRDVALEIYFKDSRSLLVVFLDKKKRSDMDHHLSGIVNKKANESLHTPGTTGLLKTPLLGLVSAKVLSGLMPDELSTAQRKWQAREISNFTYLSILNQISGRTPNDATQYPVFPWVLQDYTSKTLELSNPAVYRDLTKPMGALTAARREAAETRYTNLQSVDEKPFHYGTHFSSSMIVCHFLIRMAPFTNMFKTLQGGDWDLPDRLFIDIARAYESAAHDVRGDVRELIPEFYTCPEFLENYADLDFGVQQNTGEKIHDVKLPPWAREDPLLFVTMNRRALESNYVSEHLPAWIDLIWGSKQRDPESLNVFHPLSYEGSIDLDSITDPLEREATVGIIHNFGQTPRKLFNTPHPARYHHGLGTLPIGTLHGIEEDPHLLVQGSRCIRDLGPRVPVKGLVLDMVGERVIPCPQGVVCVPSHPHEQVEWTIGGDLRVTVDQKVVQVVEGVRCTCAAFADSLNLITGSSDYTLRMWTFSRSPSPSRSAPLSISLTHILRIHTDEVLCVAISRAWSIAVSGSKDGSAAIWDLNRAVYVRSIWHGEGEASGIRLVEINESTGYIATCSDTKLCLHTLNVRPMAVLDLRELPLITSLSFHEREYSNLGILATGGRDGSITLRTWTADGTPEGEKAKWELVTVRAMKVRPSPSGRTPAVTALKFVGESLCHGEDTGKTYLWSLPD